MTSSKDDLKDLSRISDFQRQIGVTQVEAGEGRSTVRLDAGRAARNPKGDVHGGALAALCDVAMARAVRSCNRDARGLSTVSMTVNYIAPAKGDVIASAHIVKNGTSTAFAQVDIRSEAGDMVAQASGVFRILRPAR